MTPAQQLQHFEQFVDRMRRILIAKGNDYAGKSENIDRLSNFKQAGAVAGIDAATSCMNLMGIKISRIASLLKQGIKPENESVQDSSLDLAIYAILLDAILNESKFQ